MIADLEQVSHTYGRRQALDAVSLHLNAGITALVGVNGAGKSTLLHVLATLLRPSAGTVAIAGHDPWRGNGGRLARRRLALMPQSFSPPRGVTVVEFLHYMAWLRAVPRGDRTDAVDRALEEADLVDCARERLTSLSGGMLRRAMLGQALVAQPDLLLLDEPTSGLDPEQRVRVRSLVASQPVGRAVLLSSHIMEDVVPIAQRIVMLDDGRIIFDGTPTDLDQYDQPNAAAVQLSSYERAFLALRRANSSDQT